MNNTFAGLTLPSGTRWVNKNSWSPLAMDVSRSVSGWALFSIRPLFGARPIVLEFRATDWPLLSLNDVENIKSICDQAKTTLFVWENIEYIVLPDHTSGSAYEFNQLKNYQDQSKDWFLGTLKLLTVN